MSPNRWKGTTVTIRTNNVPRLLLDAYELTAAERASVSPLADDDDAGSFFRYRGSVYALADFMRTEPGGELEAAGWQGYAADSFYSAVVVRICSDDADRVVVGTYYDGGAS